jgi:phospholipid N-methyltransferase
MTAEEQLYAAVQKVIDDYRLVGEVSPSWIATQVMSEIEFPQSLHILGYVGCHLEVRQISRQKLRHAHDPYANVKASIEAEDDLFPETLQERYPREPRKAEEPIYALRDLLTEADVRFNVERMRRGGKALLKHADALEAWNAERRRAS